MLAVLLTSSASVALSADEQKPAKPQGQWLAVEYDQNGHRLPADMVKKLKVTIRDDKIVIKPHVVAKYKSVFDNGKTKAEVTFTLDEDASTEVSYKLDQAKGRIDLVWSGGRGESKTTRGVYELDGDELKIGFATGDKGRPKKFPAAPNKASYAWC
jgi:uncharacterized protein (TIGR03067 family)